ncbi:Actin-related protein 2/3 complex subunit 3 [Aphelenchoides fujianensis]|nr:Actin-related protein 2/3 complex subunit 3 [Aphelenchoides fujianensis]
MIQGRLQAAVLAAYHSKFNEESKNLVGNMAVLPLRTKFKGPAPTFDADEADIIDEALQYFKPNIFFREYNIDGPADRTLIYLFLYITECLKRLNKGNVRRGQAIKDLTTMAIESKLPIPGESGFPFAGLFKPPANAHEEEQMRAYLQQLRQELGQRLISAVYGSSEEPSKWWLCFARRRFMDKSLSNTF